MSTNIRKIAFELLRSYEEEGRYVNLLLSSPKARGLTKEEKASLTALLYTAVEKKITYDYFISAFSKRQISEVDPFVRDIIRIGLCQILDMKSIPDYAAVNESVKLARHKGEAGFVNAVLRTAIRNKDSLPYPKREKNLARYLSVYYSLPIATVKLFMEIVGEEECEALISAMSKEVGISVTVNERKISREELIKKLESFGAKKSPYTDNGIVFEKSVSPKELPGFSEGEFFVQDESSRIAAAALDVKPGQNVIDVCSAPGGKAFAAAIKTGRLGRVQAFDIHESKISLINDGAARLGLENVSLGVRDATLPDESIFESFDRVICDVPCSGLGVFAKKPDLRYKDVDSLRDLPPLQYEILEKSSRYLKRGGIIVYSTCTINPMENECVTDKFIALHPEFSYEGAEIEEIDFSSGRITLLPHKNGTDGFYIAKLRKNND
ncbi:MAG: 16S rRNA (cytosine(967)-C(5))-methyltransferase RsmB [Ruminococcaceae bacterium]|nr:16S rRNA (cytosine(967)-C(5))-methyltransferase RsmB [Oscillospiraceae bacterium]